MTRSDPAAERLDRVFSALSDPTRRGILRQLARGEATTVAQLAAPYALAPATLSKHLSVLERAGLIQRTRDGRHLRSRLEPGSLWQGLDWLNQLRSQWDDQLDALERLLDSERRAGRR